MVRSPFWDNGDAVNAGAVTWGSGTSGIVGYVSSTNSLVGRSPHDQVGNSELYGVGSINELSNGNFVVRSPFWDNDGAIDSGAVTWVNGTSGISGEISRSNSVVSTAAYAGYGNNNFITNPNSSILIVSQPNEGNGRVVIGSQSTGFDIHPSQLISGSGAIQLKADNIQLHGEVNSTQGVTLTPTGSGQQIKIGSEAVGIFSLSAAEVSRVIAPVIEIGDSTSGNVTISASIDRSLPTNISIGSGADLVIEGGRLNTAGGTLSLSVGVGGQIQPNTAGDDLLASSVSFDADDQLEIAINGTTVDTEYTQLKVVGSVDLTGLGLLIGGNFPAITGSKPSPSSRLPASSVPSMAWRRELSSRFMASNLRSTTKPIVLNSSLQEHSKLPSTPLAI